MNGGDREIKCLATQRLHPYMGMMMRMKIMNPRIDVKSLTKFLKNSTKTTTCLSLELLFILFFISGHYTYFDFTHINRRAGLNGSMFYRRVSRIYPILILKITDSHSAKSTLDFLAPVTSNRI